MHLQIRSSVAAALLPSDPSPPAVAGGAGVMSAAHQLATSDPEGEALAALERGNREEVLTILMEAYGLFLYRFCRQMVGDPDLAEEAHQTTFVQAYEGLGRFGRRSSFRTWLFGIARHRCLDALKMARRRRARLEPLEALPEPPAGGAGGEGRVAARDLARALAKCLQSLAPRVRTAVLLRYQEGFTYPEMARASGDRPATLQARVARALPLLRRCLETQGISP